MSTTKREPPEVTTLRVLAETEGGNRVETNQHRRSRTPSLAGTPTSATGESLTITIPDFEPNRRKATGSPARPQQRREGGVTPPDITAGILEAGRQAQQQAKQRREAITSKAATNPDATPARPLLTSCKDYSQAKSESLAPAQGKTPKKTTQKEAEKQRERLESWLMLDAARQLLRGNDEKAAHRTATCHRLIVPTPSAARGDGPKLRGVDVHHTTRQDGTTRARYGNVITCGSVWACPICSARIAAKRATETEQALKAHREQGGRLMFVTLTHQHDRAGKLVDQLKKQGEALLMMQRDRQYRELCDNAGVLGMVRGLEFTHSDGNGWHAHLHFLVFLAGNEEQAERHAQVMRDIDAERRASIEKQNKTPRQKYDRQAVKIPKVTKLPKFGRDLITCWQKAAKRAGLYAHRDAQDARIISDDDATLETLARYLTKCELKQDEQGRKTWVGTGENNVEEFGGEAAHRDAVQMVEQAGQAGNIALELTMKATKTSSRTPLGMLKTYALGRIPKADTPERKAQDRHARRMGALFVEYVNATKGKNALSWGQGLKRMYLIEEMDDQDAANTEDENTALDVVLLTLTPDDWRRVLYGPRGTRGKLLETAREGNPDKVRQFVADLKHSREQDEIEKREREALKRRFEKNQKSLQAVTTTTSDAGRV